MGSAGANEVSTTEAHVRLVSSGPVGVLYRWGGNGEGGRQDWRNAIGVGKVQVPS